MTILPIVALSVVVLLLGYVIYGRLAARWFGFDPARTTPAVLADDGVDFVPAPAAVVLGGHFTAIAAAGPVVGPILAGLAFGWAPALIWILLGAIFVGAIHDSGALFASIRHKATSITQVVRQHMSPAAYATFLLFVWISLVYVIIAFADITARSFATFQEFDVTGKPLNGGAVAIGATAYLLCSIAMGVALRLTKIPWYALLPVAVGVLAVTIWKAPDLAIWLSNHGLPFMDTQNYHHGLLTKRWDLALLVYCFIASVTPMWLLLQPRGVIGATFLYAALAFGIVGAVVGGLFGRGGLTIQYPAFTSFFTHIGPLFPFLFITIACGACSGFHSIVSSGTTCKQIKSEKDIRPVAYGAMLLEALVAVFALTCVMVLPAGIKAGNPDGVYARGIGNFMNICGVPMYFAVSFGLLAFSSFVFDTLDVCTRLGRYVLQEMLGLKGIAGGAVATIITLLGPAAYLWYAPPGWGFHVFWIIFGTSNQLLAALTLVGVTVWLWRTGRPVWFTVIPATFMLASTGTALVLNFVGFLGRYRALTDAQADEAKPLMINMAVAGLLFAMGIFVVAEAVRAWVVGRRQFAAGFPVVP